MKGPLIPLIPALKVEKSNVDFMAPVDRGPLSDEVMGRNQFKFDKKGLVVKCPKGHKALDHRILSHNNKKGAVNFIV